MKWKLLPGWPKLDTSMTVMAPAWLLPALLGARRATGRPSTWDRAAATAISSCSATCKQPNQPDLANIILQELGLNFLKLAQSTANPKERLRFKLKA